MPVICERSGTRARIVARTHTGGGALKAEPNSAFVVVTERGGGPRKVQDELKISGQPRQSEVTALIDVQVLWGLNDTERANSKCRLNAATDASSHRTDRGRRKDRRPKKGVVDERECAKARCADIEIVDLPGPVDVTSRMIR